MIYLIEKDYQEIKKPDVNNLALKYCSIVIC